LLVPYAPGPTDTVARIMAQAMTKPIGTTFVVENRPSNGGILAPELLTKASPDGYTILIHHIGMATTPALYRQLRFKPLEDFEYIGLINEVPMTLIGRANLPPSNLKDLLAYIKANRRQDEPRQRRHRRGFAPVRHAVPERDPGRPADGAVQGHRPAMNDLLGGQVDFMCDQTTSTTAQIKAGKVKVYGVTHAQARVLAARRADAGRTGPEGLQHRHLARLLRAQGHAKAVVDKLSRRCRKASRIRFVKTRFNELGTDPWIRTRLRRSAAQRT
jgi:tripartite-type tricarboxylate transporter receptor subunit TctC